MPLDHVGSGAEPARDASPAASVEVLLTRYLPRLRAFVRLRIDARLRERESSSDLVQSVCREVLEHADTFRYEGEECFRAWLFKAALNKILERKRALDTAKRDPQREVLDMPAADFADLRAAIESPSQLAIAREFSARLEHAFDRLQEDHREVITLSRIVGLSHAEIARQMGRGEGAVRMLLSRALVALTAVLDEGAPPRDPESA